MTPTDFIQRFPEACENWQREIMQYPTMRDWWFATDRADWMLWCVERLTAERDMYTCADLALLWAADVFDAAQIAHTLRDCKPVVDAETADAAVRSARGPEAKAAAGFSVWTVWTEAAAMAAEAAAARAEGAARAARAAAAVARAVAEAIPHRKMKMANDVWARITCPFQEEAISSAGY